MVVAAGGFKPQVEEIDGVGFFGIGSRRFTGRTPVPRKGCLPRRLRLPSMRASSSAAVGKCSGAAAFWPACVVRHLTIELEDRVVFKRVGARFVAHVVNGGQRHPGC